jgi:hypothetical protein
MTSMEGTMNLGQWNDKTEVHRFKTSAKSEHEHNERRRKFGQLGTALAHRLHIGI